MAITSPFIAPVVDTSQSERYLQDLATQWTKQEEAYAASPLLVQDYFAKSAMHPMDKQQK